jgi:hypothetical protein
MSDELPQGSFVEAVRGFKRELVRSALAMHNGNKLKAARELGISRCYLHRLLNQLSVVEGREAAEAGEEEAELQEAEVEILRDEPERAMSPTGLRSSARIA